jgi:pimeloyl-ACP methyl ester carboxylesterase
VSSQSIDTNPEGGAEKATATLTVSPYDAYLAKCLAQPGISKRVQIAGNFIHYLEWPGHANAPVLLLVHGFMGHAHWWDFVAPALAENYRIVSMDLGGMGDSGHRDGYSLDSYVAEVAGVIRHITDKPVVVIAHSFGGRCAILTGYAHPELISRLIVIDTHVSFPDPEHKRAFSSNTGRSGKRYDDLSEAKLRFRLVPEEPGTHPLILDHMAGHALKQDGDAWIWKFDPRIIDRGAKPVVSDARALPLLKMPMDYVCGEFSAVAPIEHARRIAAEIKQGRAPIIIPAAYHHVPIGQPLALTSVLRALLAS